MRSRHVNDWYQIGYFRGVDAAEKITKKLESKIAILEQQIELLKNCWNCTHHTTSINTCKECCRQTFNQGHYDYWEMMEIKK